MSNRRLATTAIIALLACACLTAPRNVTAAGDAEKYRELLDREGAASVVQAILVAYGSETAAAELEQLSNSLAASSANAKAVLDALSAERSVEAATISAELLYRMAIHVGPRPLTDDPGWRAVTERGCVLLGHDDPFVRGMAAWALTSVRDANADAPKSDPALDWMAPCRALQPETSLDCEFVLQVFVQQEHRTARDLLRSAEAIVQRAERAAEYASACGGVEQQQHVAVTLESLRRVYGSRQDSQGSTDLSEVRRWWLDVRRAARDVILCSPDLDIREVVYFQTPVRTEGNHPDCLVQNHDRPKERPPGGDIFVQTGLAPSNSTRPVLDDQLGPGHVQDMDLWWDADRVVFAYVRQGAWGRQRYNWGSVPWRNGPDLVVFDHVVGFKDGIFSENGSEPTHLYEIRLDGCGLRQLTDDALYCDREPAYLPNGDVVFSSDRGCGASQCGAAPLAYSDFGLPNLYRVSADGKQLRRLTYNKDVDRYPHCLNNGLIGYMRWDYQERFWQWPHSLWTIRPDGTMNDGLFKVHFRDPQSVREPRSIPGSDKLVVIACGHHSPPEGAVAIVDPSSGVNNPAGLSYVTPTCTPLEGGLGSSPTVTEGGVADRGGYYRTPWPLSEKSFLVSYAHDFPGRKGFAAYYIDVWGNKELIHRDAVMDVLCPMPIRPRPRPPELPTHAGAELPYATCFLDDVNRDMPGITPGTIRYIRISEQLQWYFNKHDNTGPIRWTPGTQHSRNFGYWSWSPTRVIGTVPVESDGSAYFKVPTGLAVSFQALDENFMEVRRMRSHVEFAPGEQRGCVGCHETKEHVPRTAPGADRLALRREPSQPKPPPWGDVALLDYQQLIQPIFDGQCVRCHNATDPQSDLDLAGNRDSQGFVQSYRSLFGITKDMPTPLGEGYREAFASLPQLEPAESDLFEAMKNRIYAPGGLLCLSNHMSGPEVTAPKQFGSHQSRLVLTLLNDTLHRDEVDLTAAEWETLVTWVDANAPYFATFYQYFDAQGTALPLPIRVQVKLDPPFKAGEKSSHIVAESVPGDVALRLNSVLRSSVPKGQR